MSNYAAAILRQNDEHSDAVVAVEDINAALISKLRITPEKPKEKAPPPGFAGAKLSKEATSLPAKYGPETSSFFTNTFISDLKTPPQNVTSLPKSQSTAAVPEKSKNSQPEDVEHLEEWLDDFLDD